MKGRTGGKRPRIGKKGAGIKGPATALTRHGWTLLAHGLFLGQLETLTARAETEAADGVVNGPATKLLGHVVDLVFEKIPQNPASPAYRHGGALGGSHREWFRGKTGNGRFRLFFRYHSGEKIIVYAWLNDEESLRTTGARTDAYAVFTTMLAGGNPPASWAPLRDAAAAPEAVVRLAAAAAKRATRDISRGAD